MSLLKSDLLLHHFFNIALLQLMYVSVCIFIGEHAGFFISDGFTLRRYHVAVIGRDDIIARAGGNGHN